MDEEKTELEPRKKSGSDAEGQKTTSESLFETMESKEEKEMTGFVLHLSQYLSPKDLATREYELSKREVDHMLLNGYHRSPNPVIKAQFDAACERRNQARERWLSTL